MQFPERLENTPFKQQSLGRVIIDFLKTIGDKYFWWKKKVGSVTYALVCRVRIIIWLFNKQETVSPV